MLQDIVDEWGYLADMSEVTKVGGHEDIPQESIIMLIKAARLLLEVHQDADSGELDGVDLRWMHEVDKLIVKPEHWGYSEL